MLIFRANFITDILNSLPESAFFHQELRAVFRKGLRGMKREVRSKRRMGPRTKSKKELQEEAEDKAREEAKRARNEKNKIRRKVLCS